MKFEYTITAKTVDEAYKKARDMYSSLGDVSMEVINSGKKGFLGIFGAIPAEIKVIVDDGKEEIKPKKDKQAKKSANNDTAMPKKEVKPSAYLVKDNEKNTSAGKKEETQKPQNNQKTQKPAQKPVQKQAKKPNKPKPVAKEPAKEPVKDEDIHVKAEEKQLVIDFLKKFINNIGYDCSVSGDMTPDENGYVPRVVTIDGENAANLIGHHGETLDAIQYLANLCLARNFDGDHKEYVKVIVDIQNYRVKREEALRALARRMCDKAIKYKRNVLLEPMNPYERRIIHSEAQKIDGVSTHSVGYDENRKIVITYEGEK